MSKWEKFEEECYKYLTNTYKDTHNITFKKKGGSDSTTPDIEIIKDKVSKGYIEAKMNNAQSGQFVLIPDMEKQKFTFSCRNKSKQNCFTESITSYMNNNFERFNNAGTSGENLEIDSNIFSKWIVDYYTKKNVRYFITKESDYIIFPTNKFGEYFDVKGKYRIKKSGSKEPAKKDITTILNILKNEYGIEKSSVEGKKLFVFGVEDSSKIKFQNGNYTYILSPKSENKFEVRRLSNTYNMNVIFCISLKKKQDQEDLEMFENYL